MEKRNLSMVVKEEALLKDLANKLEAAIEAATFGLDQSNYDDRPFRKAFLALRKIEDEIRSARINNKL